MNVAVAWGYVNRVLVVPSPFYMPKEGNENYKKEKTNKLGTALYYPDCLKTLHL